MAKKIIKWFCLLIIAAWLLFALLPLAFFKKVSNPNPLPETFSKGAYHMHSRYSDGGGTIEEMADAAAEEGLDFIIVTDHGNPNLKCAESTGRHRDVLIIGGSEFDMNAGHMAAIGFSSRPYRFPPEPMEAIGDVDRDNGVTFISHPFDSKIPWTDWDINGFSGIEILSSYTGAKQMGFLQWTTFPVQYPIHPDYFILKTLKYPRKNLALWDSLLEKGKYYGIYSLDAHSRLKIYKKLYLRFPTYRSVFRFLTVYVKHPGRLDRDPQKAADTITASIRKGNFFNVVESLSSANGFENIYLEKNRTIEMGGSSEYAGGIWVIKCPFRFPVDIVVKKDGEIYKAFRDTLQDEIHLPVMKSGVYRTEVYISRFRNFPVPWIMGNPIFIGVRYPPTPVPTDESDGAIMPVLEDFHIEKNPLSSAQISLDRKSEDMKILSLRYQLKKAQDVKDFWVSAAIRRNFDLSDYQGISFQSMSDISMRYWFEIRTGTGPDEKWYRHSFLATPQWSTKQIPFHKMHRHNGIHTVPEPSDITSIFFSINNAIAYDGTAGALSIKNIHLVRK